MANLCTFYGMVTAKDGDLVNLKKVTDVITDGFTPEGFAPVDQTDATPENTPLRLPRVYESWVGESPIQVEDVKRVPKEHIRYLTGVTEKGYPYVNVAGSCAWSIATGLASGVGIVKLAKDHPLYKQQKGELKLSTVEAYLLADVFGVDPETIIPNTSREEIVQAVKDAVAKLETDLNVIDLSNTNAHVRYLIQTILDEGVSYGVWGTKGKPYGISIEALTTLFPNVHIELYSEEQGMAFQEHVVVTKGNFRTLDVTGFHTFYIEEPGHGETMSDMEYSCFQDLLDELKELPDKNEPNFVRNASYDEDDGRRWNIVQEEYTERFVESQQDFEDFLAEYGEGYLIAGLVDEVYDAEVEA